MVFIRCDYLPAMRTGLYATPNPAAMMPAAVLMKPPIPGLTSLKSKGCIPNTFIGMKRKLRKC